MLVRKENFREIISYLAKSGDYGLDTETFGLEETDRLFSIIISDEFNDYYFNFYYGRDYIGSKFPDFAILPRTYLKYFNQVFSNVDSTWYIHNAKFDMQKLWLDDMEIAGRVVCTQAMERLIRNDLMSYSLNNVAKLYGVVKDDKVEACIAENKLYTMIKTPGKATKQKNKHFEKVPLEIIVPYGEKDARITRTIGRKQLETLGINRD